MSQTKTAFIAIVGCPNVGKSSILNRFLGQKIAIVTPKPQTTRTKITGILTEGELQLVFTDTPGMHRPKNRLGEKMVKAVGESIAGVDACLLVVEPRGELREAEMELIEKLKKEKNPAILVINKIDTISEKTELYERAEKLSRLYNFEAVLPVSAVKGDNMNELLEELKKLAKPSVHFFPEDSLTDQPERILAAEIIREKLLMKLDQEIPHETAVCIEKMSEREDGLLDIMATIYCARDGHKGIIIGKKGETLKTISTKARIDLERFFMCKINLHCFVKVKEGWRNKESAIRDFGLN